MSKIEGSTIKFEVKKFNGKETFDLWQKRVNALLVQQVFTSTVQRLGRVGDESAKSYPSQPAPRRESESRVGRLNSEETDSAENQSDWLTRPNRS